MGGQLFLINSHCLVYLQTPVMMRWGGSFGLDWFYFNWNQDLPEVSSLHINEKETLAVVLAAQRWAKVWENKRIILQSDNMTVVSRLNRGTCKNKLVMQCLRHLFWLSTNYSLHLTARHIPGHLKIAADRAICSCCSLLQHVRPLGFICHHILSAFFLTYSRGGGPSSQCNISFLQSDMERTGFRSLPESLDKEIQFFRDHSFDSSTNKTYQAQKTAFFEFCTQLGITPVPLSQENLGRYIAFLSRILDFSSICQYLNVINLLHLEAGLSNPHDNNWYVSSILKGVKRVKGHTVSQKLPITIEILTGILTKLIFHRSLNRRFWAACLVAFYTPV